MVLFYKTYNGREVDALPEAPDGVSDGEGENEEEATEEEDIRYGSRHGVDPTGWSNQLPAVSRTLLLRDTCRT